MKSVWHKILRVNLSTGTCKPEEVPDRVYEYFLGGAGLIAWVLYKECPAGTKAFDPENRLTFAVGPLQGLKQTGAAKWSAGAISPSINMNSEAAATASWGIELKKTGHDAIIVHGKADKPVYIVVEDDRVEIKDASHLWGRDAYDASDAIKEAEGDKFEVISIGQAAEKLVRYANIQTSKKSFLGRCGLGAVMGSKLLKGIAVRGTQICPIHDPEEIDRLNNSINRRLAEVDSSKPKEKCWSYGGTAIATALFAPQGNLPVKNYQLATFPNGVKEFDGVNYVEELDAKPWPCPKCVIGVITCAKSRKGLTPTRVKGRSMSLLP